MSRETATEPDRLAHLLPAVTASPAQTRALGARLAALLRQGDVVALYGDLGAGKTQLVKGVCAGLGIERCAVTSPTFTLLHEYEGGRLLVYHFDAYRITRPDELFELGCEEYVYGEGLCLIEWAGRVEPLLPPEALCLRLAHRGGDQRLISRIEDRE